MALPTFLDISEKPEPADAIFVFAGREERKRYGVELFREGYAPRLILSVGRFEWRRFEALGLWSDGGLVEMVPTIEAPERHFFVHVTDESARCEAIDKGFLGTMTEARALATVIEDSKLQSVIVVSSPEHLPRCVVALTSVADPDCQLIPVGSEPSDESLGRELAKLVGYGIAAIPGLLRR